MGKSSTALKMFLVSWNCCFFILSDVRIHTETYETMSNSTVCRVTVHSNVQQLSIVGFLPILCSMVSSDMPVESKHLNDGTCLRTVGYITLKKKTISFWTFPTHHGIKSGLCQPYHVSPTMTWGWGCHCAEAGTLTPQGYSKPRRVEWHEHEWVCAAKQAVRRQPVWFVCARSRRPHGTLRCLLHYDNTLVSFSYAAPFSSLLFTSRSLFHSFRLALLLRSVCAPCVLSITSLLSCLSFVGSLSLCLS